MSSQYRDNWLDLQQWQQALLMWRAGKDTKDIAIALRVEEWVVYNGLSRMREKMA